MDFFLANIELCMVLLALCLTPIFLKLSFAELEKRRERAREIATRIGLNFHDPAERLGQPYYSGSADFSEVGIAGRYTGSDNLSPEQLRMLLKIPLISKFILLSLPWYMDGRISKIEVSASLVVQRSGNSTSRGVGFSALFTPGLPFELSVFNESLAFKLGRAFRRVQDIPMGDDQFDQKLIIQGSDEARIRDWITAPKRRATLLELFQRRPEARLDHEGLHLVVWKTNLKADDYLAQFDELTAALRELL